MRVSLKIKLTLLISILVLLVVLATSAIYLSALTKQALQGVSSRGEYVANELYNQAHDVLAHSEPPPWTNALAFQERLYEFVTDRLSHDPGLNYLLKSAIGYSPTLYYVAITDANHEVMVHNDPGEIGHKLARVPRFSDLLASNLREQLRAIYGRPHIYEIVMPLQIGENFLDVRVGVSTLFLRDDVTPVLRRAALFSALVIGLTTLSAGLLSLQLLRPLETISEGVDRMARGEYSESIQVNRMDEWGVLSSKLNLLGAQMRGEKAAFVALQENLDQLFSKLADGLLLFDKQDRVVLATPAVSHFLNRRPAELARKSASEVFSANDPLDRLLQQAFRRRESLPWRTVEMDGDSATQRVSVSIQFIEGERERLGALVTLRDASTRARLEDQIDVAAKLTAIGKLTSGVAHEVKNPLNAMVLQLELLKAKLGDHQKKVSPQLDVLSAELRRLDRVVKTFLDFTRPVELHLMDVEVPVLIREVFTLAEPQAAQNNVQLLFDSNGTLPRLRLDPDLMKQALLNLVLNGCQAMPQGGELKVTPRVHSDHVDIDIADQGTGIPPDVRSKIFALFFSTKPSGSGIGLAMAFRIVQLHNGKLDFASEINRGTTFRVSLPC
jgi:signal transduction histidine kinase